MRRHALMAEIPTEPFVLRRATNADAQRLAEIDEQVNPSPWSADGFRESLENHARGIVGGLTPDRVDGFVMYSQVVDDAEILNLAVDGASQRNGLGKQLLRAALTEARRGGATHCFLEVRASNTAAQALYLACGFLQSGRRNGYYRASGQREDALIYTLRFE
jgi:[ribosomal protein S18]-alanine N-acetyltransferase